MLAQNLYLRIQGEQLEFMILCMSHFTGSLKIDFISYHPWDKPCHRITVHWVCTSSLSPSPLFPLPSPPPWFFLWSKCPSFQYLVSSFFLSGHRFSFQHTSILVFLPPLTFSQSYPRFLLIYSNRNYLIWTLPFNYRAFKFLRYMLKSSHNWIILWNRLPQACIFSPRTLVNPWLYPNIFFQNSFVWLWSIRTSLS